MLSIEIIQDHAKDYGYITVKEEDFLIKMVRQSGNYFFTVLVYFLQDRVFMIISKRNDIYKSDYDSKKDRVFDLDKYTVRKLYHNVDYSKFVKILREAVNYRLL